MVVDSGVFIILHIINWYYDNLRTGNTYRLTSNTRGTLVGKAIVDHSDVVGASSVGAAPITSSLST